MKRSLSLLLALGLLAGCTRPAGQGNLTLQERTERYRSAIEAARPEEDGGTAEIVTAAEGEEAQRILGMLGLRAEDMKSWALVVSPADGKACGIAAVYPAEGREQAVQEALRGYIDNQKRKFRQYPAEDYSVASRAKLNTLADGTVLLVLCEDQDRVYEAIRVQLEGA